MSYIPQAAVYLLALLLAGALGCSGPQLAPPTEAAAPAPAPVERPEHPDQATLKAALQGRYLSPREALELSDRLLVEGSLNFQDQETMARLELLLLGAVKGEEKTSRAGLLRNLGIIHYHQKKFKQARQELQGANEINPKDARTHFYLARLHARQEQVYLRKGDKKRAKGQGRLADTEQGLARKLEPSNSLYRQDIREIIRQEPAK